MNNNKEIQGLRDDISRIAKRLEKLTSHNSDEVASTISDYVDSATDSLKEYAHSASNSVKEQALVTKERATEAAKQTQRYAQENPWTVAGIAAGTALVIGLLAASRRNRD